METTRVCDMCFFNKTFEEYRKYTYKTNSYSKTCKKCLNEKDKVRKKNLRIIKNNTDITKCEKCNEEKTLNNFAKLKKFYKKKICLSCYPSFLNEQKNKWCKDESDSNPNYRLKKSLAARLRTVLKKETHTMNYIGCSIEYLKEWFEYNFTDEMNWNNYGSYWSIDHVLPVNKFNLINIDETLRCWNWSNLVPVTINYNSSKKSTFDMNQINNVKKKLQSFKEEGSTTKWFSEDFILDFNKLNI